jgi:signal transduction histidine kinase
MDASAGREMEGLRDAAMTSGMHTSGPRGAERHAMVTAAWTKLPILRRPTTIRGLLVWMVIGCVVPGWIGIAVLIVGIYQAEREQAVQSTAMTARALLLALDRHFTVVQNAAEGLAKGAELAAGDLAAFYRTASAVIGNLPDNNITLTDQSGQVLLDTLLPFGGPLPMHGNIRNIRQVFATGEAATSYWRSAASRSRVSIDVPVFRDGKVNYALGIGFPTVRLSRLLDELGLPSGWIGSILDETGLISVRSRDAEIYVGQPAPPGLIAEIARSASGFLATQMPDGVSACAGFARSARSHWAVTIDIPCAEMDRRLRMYLAMSGAGAIVLLVIAIGVAAAQSRRITSAALALVGPAEALGRGEAATTPRSGIREIDGVAQGLDRALQVLQERTRQRDHAEQERLAVQRAARLKDEFIATVSHELRTPMTSLAAALSLLAGADDGRSPEKAGRLVTIAHANSQRLVRLLNDILDVEKLEAGTMAFDPQRIEVNALVARVVDAARPVAATGGVRLRLECTSPHAVHADPARLAQVVSSLLSNAIKFSPRDAEVVLAVRICNDKVRISVRDNGPGIAADFRPHIFEKFSRADASDARTQAGTGLGLSIAKKIVQQLGGEIGYADAPGGGTIFFIDLDHLGSGDGGDMAPPPRRARLAADDEQPSGGTP